MYTKNHLRECLENGTPAVGCWNLLCSPMALEIVGLAGFDFTIIDHEHGPSDFLNAVSLMHAVSATQMTPVMRVPWNDPVYMKRALDIGVQGIMVPSVNTAAEAKAAVEACNYPPKGIRGAAYPWARASDYGLKAANYVEDAPKNFVLICQIESVEAVQNIPEIAAVDGVDLLFIGPLDLSASMGIIGQTETPAFKELRAKAEEAIKDSGKWLGGLVAQGDSAQAMIDRGYAFVSGVSDLSLLRDSAVAHLKSLGRA